jgi:hypothetical protein
VVLVTFQPGRSGNPGGRSRAFAAMSRRILELSKNGDELVDFLFATLRDTTAELKMRVHCAELLLDRSLGKAPQTIDISGDSDMTEEEYNAEIALIIREAVATMTPSERMKLLATTDPAPSTTIQ